MPGKKSSVFSDEEKAAMRELTRERKRGAANGEADVLAKIAELSEADRVLAQGVHELIRAAAPELAPRTWYGMPAYSKDGNVVVFFQPAQKFKARYATLGFNDRARLDEGEIWPVAYAVDRLGPAAEKKITELVKRAVSSKS